MPSHDPLAPETKLLELKDVTVKYLDRLVFQQLDFVLHSGEHWAIIGDSGSEMTAFLETLMGNTVLAKGNYAKPFAENYLKSKQAAGEVSSFRDLMVMVSQKYPFKNKSNLQQFYYQQRFNSMDSEDTWDVSTFLDQVKAKRNGPWTKEKVMTLFLLDHLKDESLIKLSNGETRRLALAAALMKNPMIFLMDQPMTGLDIATRKGFDSIMEEISRSGIHLILTSTYEEIPGFVTHVGVLKNQRVAIQKPLGIFRQHSIISKSEKQNDFQILDQLGLGYKSPDFKRIIQMKQVTVRYDGKKILDSVDWEVFPGERWALEGPNGAGKSTLLSLVQGEHPQAYANDISLFDRRRGTGESIWDIKKHLGFVAPELIRFFPANQSFLQMVLSGLYDTIGLYRKVSEDQKALALMWLDAFGIRDLAHLRLNQVTLENQRFGLLARALIKWPVLLILDEAAQGMDVLQRSLFRKTLDRIFQQLPMTLIYVSHYPSDIPACVEKTLRLEAGKVV